MKRRLAWIATLCCFLAFTMLAYAAIAAAPEIYLDGVKVPEKPRVIKGVVYLPIYALAKALKVDLVRDYSLNIVKLNGELIQAMPMETQTGEVLIPVESVVRSMGGNYEANGVENVIRITSKGQDIVKLPYQQPALPLNPQPTPVTYPPTPEFANENFPSPTQVPTPYSTPNYPPMLPDTPPITGYSPPPRAPAYPQPIEYPFTPAAPTTPIPTPTPTFTPIPEPPTPTSSNTSSFPSAFTSRTLHNNIFSVSVTNLEVLDSIKGYYRPREGYQFVILYVSQQNISNEVQIYTGTFTLRDQISREYPYAEGLSNFWLVILSPGGTNFGYLVFEIPATSSPYQLILRTLNQSPLVIDLKGGKANAY